jgi:hypothetical protein
LELAPITIVFHAKLLNPQAEYLKGRQVVKAGMRFLIEEKKAYQVFSEHMVVEIFLIRGRNLLKPVILWWEK